MKQKIAKINDSLGPTNIVKLFEKDKIILETICHGGKVGAAMRIQSLNPNGLLG
jgi:hypothetical protein